MSTERDSDNHFTYPMTSLATALDNAGRAAALARRDHRTAVQVVQQGMACTLAFRAALQYGRAAPIQINRVQKASNAARSLFAEGDEHSEAARLAVEQSHAELHFYATCWNMVEKNLGLLKRLSGLSAPKKALKEHGKTLRHYGKLRDHFEHMDQRLPGNDRSEPFVRANPEEIRWGWQGGGDTIAAGDDSWDVSDESGQLLLSIVHYLIIDLEDELGVDSELLSLF